MEENPAQPNFILTVWGVGYKFAEPKGTADDAHVRVHADEHDVRDPALLHHVPHLDARVADGIVVADGKGVGNRAGVHALIASVAFVAGHLGHFVYRD